jgi:hypothetical protein
MKVGPVLRDQLTSSDIEKEDYLYYRNGRDFIELKKTAKPIRQEGESVQDYAIRKFRIVTRDFTAFDIEE